MTEEKPSRMKITVKMTNRGHRLSLDNYYQEMTYADVVRLAVEALDAVSDGDARKIWEARRP